MFRLSVLIPTLLAISVSQAAAAVIIDGDLTDWGVPLDAGNHLDFAAGMTNVSSHPGYHGVVNGFMGGKMYYHAEDSYDNSNSYYVGPDYGGQNYDAEFLGAAVLDSVLYVGIATGQRPDNGFGKFGPGDVRIETSAGVFGLEVGGGKGDYGRTYGQIGLGDAGTTYFMYGSGTTKAIDLLPPHGPASPHQTAGSLWLTDPGDWIDDPISPPAETQFQILTGTHAGTATDYVYNYGSAPCDFGQHAFIEFSLDTALFGGGKIESIAWRPSCGNDELEVTFPEESDPVIPEPASLVVWSLLASLGVGCCWQRFSGRKRR